MKKNDLSLTGRCISGGWSLLQVAHKGDFSSLANPEVQDEIIRQIIVGSRNDQNIIVLTNFLFNFAR